MMKLSRLRISSRGNLVILMNIISLLYLLVNIQCVNEDANKQYSILCLDDKCTEKIADGRVNQVVTPENNDYLNANLNDSFDVLGFNKDVYLVRKQSKEGLVPKKYIKILKTLHTPITPVELSFKNQRINVFIRKHQQSHPDNTQEHLKSFQQAAEIINKTQELNLIDKQKQVNNSKIDSKLNLLDDGVEKSLKLENFEKKAEINQLSAQKQTDSEPNLKRESSFNNINDEKSEEKILSDEELSEEIDLENNQTLDDELNKIDDSIEENELEEENRSINILTDSHYVNQMNSIESSTETTFNQADSLICTLPPPDQTNEMNFYLDILRNILGKVFVDRLPENIVTLLKIKLLVSVHLIVFVLLIGIIWLISYFVSLIYLSIDYKTKLKNQVCELQAQLSCLRNENQLIKKSALQTRHSEFEQKRNKLEKTIDELLDEKSKIESKYNQLKIRVQTLEVSVKEVQNEKENLSKNLKMEKLNKTELKSDFSERIKKLEDEQIALDNYCLELKKQRQENQNKLEEQAKNLSSLKQTLDELRLEIKKKDNEIECLNKIYKELKEQKLIEKSESNDSISSSSHQHNIDQLRHDLEKMQKERDKFKIESEKFKKKIGDLEEKACKFEEYERKLICEKEDAERFNEFSKKYMKEKEDELQEQVNLIRNELEQTKKLYLNSEKYSSDYWKENQTLKNDLNLLKRDNEQLRIRIAELMQTNPSRFPMPLPPEMPQSVFNYIRSVTSPTASIQSPQSPSNQSQLSDYYQQQQHTYSTNSLSHHSLNTSPTHSLNNISSRSGSFKPNESFQQILSPTGNHSYFYPQTPNSSSSNLSRTQQQSSIYSPTLHQNSSTPNKHTTGVTESK